MLIFEQKLLTEAFQRKNFTRITFKTDFYHFTECALAKEA